MKQTETAMEKNGITTTPKTKTYVKPETEVIRLQGSLLMDTWSIGIDNDPDHGIGPGDEDDIGAKKGFFDNDVEDNTPLYRYNLWED